MFSQSVVGGKHYININLPKGKRNIQIPKSISRKGKIEILRYIREKLLGEHERRRKIKAKQTREKVKRLKAALGRPRNEVRNPTLPQTQSPTTNLLGTPATQTQQPTKIEYNVNIPSAAMDKIGDYLAGKQKEKRQNIVSETPTIDVSHAYVPESKKDATMNEEEKASYKFRQELPAKIKEIQRKRSEKADEDLQYRLLMLDEEKRYKEARKAVLGEKDEDEAGKPPEKKRVVIAETPAVAQEQPPATTTVREEKALPIADTTVPPMTNKDLEREKVIMEKQEDNRGLPLEELKNAGKIPARSSENPIPEAKSEKSYFQRFANLLRPGNLHKREKAEIDKQLKAMEETLAKNSDDPTASKSSLIRFLDKKDEESWNKGIPAPTGVGMHIRGAGISPDEIKPISAKDLEIICEKIPGWRGIAMADTLTKLPWSNTNDNAAIFNKSKLSDNDGGTHWMSIWISPVKDKSVEVYDSLNQNLDAGVLQQIRKIVDGLGLRYELTYKKNPKRNQIIHKDGNSTNSCGYMARQFLVNRARGDPFEKACNLGTPEKAEGKLSKIEEFVEDKLYD